MAHIKAVLMVDDDVDDRDLFCEALLEVDSSLQCIHASSGEQAFTLLTASGARLPDIIFLDLNMPRLNGLQCLQVLKQDKALAHIPVVIYSTSWQEKDRLEAERCGAAAFITKPSAFKEICQSIAGVLELIRGSVHSRR
jgi:CheY-like chemotaxis protein